MSVGGLSRPLPRLERRDRASLRRLSRAVASESLLVVVAAGCVLFWAVAAPSLLGNDSWMTIVWGREIAAHGIPFHDALTLMTHGKAWVDQQWLAQLAFWEMFRIGGIRLALAATIVLLLAPVALALALARRRGASAASIVPFALLPILDFSSILRAQLFSQLLFVVLLGLLLAESRRRSRRIMLAFPLLALWANLHGAALVGAVLVSLLGLHELRTRRTIRAFALVVAPWPCLVATPYGLATVGYYRGLFGNPVIRAIETEWRAPTFASVMGFALFVLAGAAVALVARRPRDLNPFELGVLAFTLVGAMLAVRSIPWFAYACLVLLPPLVERTWRRRPLQATPTALGLVVAITAGAAASAALLLAVLQPMARLTPLWPGGAAAAVTNVLRDDPHARVFASYEYPDWLLLASPRTRGRIAYDGRFEVLSHGQLKSVMNYLWRVGGNWERPAAGYRLLVLDPQLEKSLVATYDARRGVRTLFRSKDVVVFDQGPR